MQKEVTTRIKAGKVKEHEQIQANIHDILRQQGQIVERCEGYEKAKEVINKLITTIDN